MKNFNKMPSAQSNKVDGITERKLERKLSEYFDYNKENYSISKALENFGIDPDIDSLNPETKKEREFSEKTMRLYSSLKEIVGNEEGGEWKKFKDELRLRNDKESEKEVLSYNDLGIKGGESEAFAKRNIMEEGLLSSDALKCFEDEVRTKIFFETILRKIDKNDEVLEAGTGTGIMAIVAAVAGAKKITALELNPITAEFAKRVIKRCEDENIIEKNRIEIIQKNALNYYREDGKKFNAFISENIYTGQFNELQMQINNHLNQFIDVDQGKIIPRAMVNGIEVSNLTKKLSDQVRDRPEFTRKDFENKGGDSTVNAMGQAKFYDVIDFSEQAELGVRNRFVETIANDGEIDSVTIFSLVQMSGDKGDFIGRNETNFLNDDMVVILKPPPLSVKKDDRIEIYIEYKAADKPGQANIRVQNMRSNEERGNIHQ